MNVRITNDNIPEIVRQSVAVVEEDNLKEFFNIIRNRWDTGSGFTKNFYDSSDTLTYSLTFSLSNSDAYLRMYARFGTIFSIRYTYSTQVYSDIVTNSFIPPYPEISYVENTGTGISSEEFDHYFYGILNFRITDNIFSMWAYKCIDKLKKINTKLDYMLQIPSTRVDGSISFTTNITGITTTSGSTMYAYLVGNYLFLFHNMTLSSAAQSSVGTGNFTAKLVGTYTITNFVASSPSADNADNLKKISSATPVGANYEIASNTGYTTGNGQPAAFFWRSSISGTSLKVQLYVKAVKTATSNWQLSVLIPVLRVPPYTG